MSGYSNIGNGDFQFPVACVPILVAEEKKQAYFAAVQAGLDKNYQPMERLIPEIIERSLGAA